jgi:enoyl-CoA hydratase
MTESVLVDVVDRVATVTLNEPDKRNAISQAIVEGIGETFDALEADEGVGAIVITGAPPAFCAGADLSHLGTSREQGLRAIYEGFLRLSRCPLPTLAAVNGAAVGAGLNMALSCDVRLAAESAKFDTRFLQLGLHPGGGYTWMLRRIAGVQATMAAGVFGDVLDGREAERVGMVWRCVPDDELLAAAQAMAAKAASAPRELAMRVKATIEDMATIDEHEAAVDRELVDQLWSMDQPDFAERLAQIQARISGKQP